MLVVCGRCWKPSLNCFFTISHPSWQLRLLLTVGGCFQTSRGQNADMRHPMHEISGPALASSAAMVRHPRGGVKGGRRPAERTLEAAGRNWLSQLRMWAGPQAPAWGLPARSFRRRDVSRVFRVAAVVKVPAPGSGIMRYPLEPAFLTAP